MHNFNLHKLSDKEVVNDLVLLVKTKYIGLGKNGRSYLTLTLGNLTGIIDARLWDQVEEIGSTFDIGDLVKIKGHIQIYNNRKQLVLHKIDKNDDTQYKTEDFLTKEKTVDAQQLFAVLMNYINKIENQHIRQICLDTVNDDTIKSKLLVSPAARSIHHAHKTGLLKHTISILDILDFMAKHYSHLNRDLLFFGGLFHDIGKIEELDLTPDKQIIYTEKGQLLGHIMLACELIEKKSQRILGFPEELKVLLKHMVLSHHGKIEYGSPKLPQFQEAVVVAMIDELDSKIDQIYNFVESEKQTGERWSRYNDYFGRYFLIEDLKEKWKP